jgi:hypothetical protein
MIHEKVKSVLETEGVKSNCYGTAFYVAGLIERDRPVEPKHAEIVLGFLNTLSFPQLGSLVTLEREALELGQNVYVPIHTGIIVENGPGFTVLFRDMHSGEPDTGNAIF